jgi:hypothetical protein
MEGVQMSEYTTTNNTSLTLEKFNTEPVMTIHPDGRVTVSDKFKPDEAAAKVVEAFKTQWLADIQCAKIHELQSNLNESNELIEHLRDKIKLLKETGNELRNCASRIGTVASGEASIIRWTQEAIQDWDNKTK